MPDIRGLGTPSTTTLTRTGDTTPAAQPQSSTPTATTPQGWQGTTGTRGTVNANVTPPPPSAADVRASMPNPVRTAVDSALTRFESRVESTLGHDAMSMARGRTPVREGDALTAAQQNELKQASVDLLKDLPIGALSPQLAAGVQAKLQDAGLDTRDVASLRLGNLGALGSDIAKDLLKDLKADSPAAYYSLAATLGAAAGIAAWTGGSAKLASLGIKPEIKQGFFDDHLQLKLGATWDAHFKNFSPTATVSGRYDVTPNLNLSATATANLNGVQSIGGNLTWKPSDDFSLSAGVRHDFATDRTTANAEAAWRVNANTDFALSASHDSAGDSRVGVGVRVRF